MSGSNGTSSPAMRLWTRFAGLARAHGHFRPNGVERERDGKQEGFTETIHAPATVELWQGHVQGLYGIGIIPIRDDATCVWGAIDIDIDKQPSLTVVAKQVADLDLPLIPCRSKSGGVHLFLCCTEPVSATVLRGKLMEWAVVLGFSGVEVFPKQTRLAGPRDYGNWINMPYFNASSTARYAVDAAGSPLSLDAFLQLADDLALSASELQDIGMPTDMTFGDALAEAPPCLQCIAGKGGAGAGHRNKFMFNIGVFLRKRHGDAWEAQFDAFNQEPYVDTALPSKEMQGLVRSINRKQYEYTCNEAPIANVCSRQICLTRKYGIGGGDGDPGVVFGSLVKLKTTPPTWIWDVNGVRLELTTDQLKDQTRFHTVAMEMINIWPKLIKPNEWAALIRQKLETVEEIEVPPDARPDGQMWGHLQSYTTGRVKAKNRDELLNDKPWLPTEEDVGRYGDQVQFGRIYFRATHFLQYLNQQRMANMNERKLWGWLRNKGAEHHTFNINGKTVNIWSVAAFAEQTEPHAIPRLSHEEM